MKKKMMKTKPIMQFTGLILCSVLLASCARFRSEDQTNAFEELRGEISQTVAEPARADAMQQQLDTMADLVNKLKMVRNDQRIKLNAQIKNYSTTRAELEATMEGFLKERQVITEAFFDAHYAFKAQASAEEWKRLAKKEKAAFAWVVEQAQSDNEGGA